MVRRVKTEWKEVKVVEDLCDVCGNSVPVVKIGTNERVTRPYYHHNVFCDDCSDKELCDFCHKWGERKNFDFVGEYPVHRACLLEWLQKDAEIKSWLDGVSLTGKNEKKFYVVTVSDHLSDYRSGTYVLFFLKDEYIGKAVFGGDASNEVWDVIHWGLFE